MKKDLRFYWTLFSSTFILSAFTFGGGFVIVSLMKKKFVDKLGWIDEDEMLNMVAVAQCSPGAIAVNGSVLVGYKMAGFIGAIIATIGTVLPPLIILTIISFFYQAFRESAMISAALKGMQAGVAAVIIDVVLTLGSNVVKTRRVVSVVLMIASFFAVFFFEINIILIILVCAFVGAVTAIYKDKIRKGEDADDVS